MGYVKSLMTLGKRASRGWFAASDRYDDDMPTKAWRGDGAPKKDSINELDCPQCQSWFPTFTALAEHVQKRHTGPEASGVWPSNATQPERSLDNMAKLPKARRPAAATPARKPTKSSSRIPGAARDNVSDYNPFLKALDIGALGASAKLTLTGNVRVADGVYGQQIIAEARYRGSLYDWAIKLNSPNHRHLEDLIGTETRKWKGKAIAVVIKENMGRDYIAVQASKKHARAAR